MKDIISSETERLAESVQRDEAFEFQGALNLMHRMHESLGANLIYGIMKVEDEKLWRRMGYRSFVDYLNSDKVPFGSTKFYDLKKLLKHEKAASFNFLSDRNISRSARLCLAENNVEIELDEERGEMVIGGKRVPADDKAAIVELVNAVKDSLVLRDHRENADKVKTEKQTKKLQKQLEEKNRTIASLQHSNFNDLTDNPHMKARLELGLAYNRMREAALKLSDIEKDQFRDSVFEDIARWRNDLTDCYKTDTPKAPVERPAIDPNLSNDEWWDKMFEGMNDSDYNIDHDDLNDRKLTELL